MNSSLFEHINRGAKPGDCFTITGIDLKGSIHSFTDDEWVAPEEWCIGERVELLEPQPQTQSPRGRVRFAIGDKVWAGKAHALRLIVTDE